ncbi:MAG: hypothetical protein V1829_00355 [bacterium]
MAKSTKIRFSKEHTGKSSGERETDTYRQKSDSSHTEKIGHNPSNPGYGNTPVNIKVN